jgi:steroid 5-alpha reductase family enzyme
MKRIFALVAVVYLLGATGAFADGSLTVMTRNLYLGADLAPVFAAETPEEFSAAAQKIGKGTPAPTDPPTVLVTSGLYRWTRNPIYMGGLLIVLGHYLYSQSRILLAYLALVFLFFHCIVIFYEEPHMRRQFGEAYKQYCKQVPRWFVRFG